MAIPYWMYMLPRTNEVCPTHKEILRDTGIVLACLKCHEERDENNARLGRSLLDQVTHITTHEIEEHETIL